MGSHTHFFSGGGTLERTVRKPTQRSLFPILTTIPLLLALAGCQAKPATSDIGAEQKRLQSLGYVGGTRPPRTEELITIHKREQVSDGLNLYNSAHAPEAFLMDMDGQILHRWSLAFEDAFPGAPFRLPPNANNWRRVYMYPNGDLLAIFEGIGLIKIDRDSKLLWAQPVQAHHDLHVMGNGQIYVLTRRAHIVPRIDPARPVLEDFVSILDSKGRPLQHHSLLAAVEQAGIELTCRDPDIFHTNSLEVLGPQAAGVHPAFREGNVLVSMRHENLIAVFDPDARQIVWWRRGEFREQHDPKVLANGNLLLFDNTGPDKGSAIYEFSLTDWKVVWSYQGTADHPFDSARCGTAQRLENGNTLITESSGGRAFEVTASGEMVWEFHNPHRFQERLVADLFELVRLPPNFQADWTLIPNSIDSTRALAANSARRIRSRSAEALPN